MPLFTVTIPHYRQPERFFRRSLESAIAQSEHDIEIVVVDDLLDDSPAPRVIAEYGDPRVRYVRNPGTHGIGGAWNACIDAAQTELFMILHADDVLERDYVATMRGLAEGHPDADLYFCRARIIGPDDRRIFSFPDFIKTLIEPRSAVVTLHGEGAVANLAFGNFIICPTLTYRRSRLGARRFSLTSRFVVDLEFTAGVLLDGGTIVGTRKFAFRYRRHEVSSTSQFIASGYRFLEEVAFHRSLAQRAAQVGWHRAASVARAMPLVRANVFYTALIDALRGRWRDAGRKISTLRYGA